MIYMYNETKTPWELTQITPKLKRLTIEKSTKDGKAKRLSVLTTTDIDIPNIDTFVDMDDIAVIYNGDSGVFYQKKDQGPVITGNTKYDKDIFVIGLNLSGSFVKDITIKGVQILNYLVANNQFNIVLSSSIMNRNSNIAITLYNSRTNTEKVYTFIYNAELNKFVVNVDILENMDRADDEPIEEVQPYKLTKFRPPVITNCVIVAKENMDVLINKVLHKPDIFYINSFETEDELKALIARLKQERYYATTLFMDTNNPKDISGLTFATIKNTFGNVNVLLNDGKVIRR